MRWQYVTVYDSTTVSRSTLRRDSRPTAACDSTSRASTTRLTTGRDSTTVCQSTARRDSTTVSDSSKVSDHTPWQYHSPLEYRTPWQYHRVWQYQLWQYWSQCVTVPKSLTTSRDSQGFCSLLLIMKLQYGDRYLWANEMTGRMVVTGFRDWTCASGQPHWKAPCGLFPAKNRPCATLPSDVVCADN